MKIALPDSYLAAIEAARRPGAAANERALAHIIDALIVLLLCTPDADCQDEKSPTGS